MGENRQTFHHTAQRPCSRVPRMDGDKPLSRGLNPRDKLSINSHLGIVNIKIPYCELSVGLHNFDIV